MLEKSWKQIKIRELVCEKNLIEKKIFLKLKKVLLLSKINKMEIVRL